MDNLLVFKFGGACLKNESQIANALKILEHFKGQKILLVVSAIDKTTNALEKVVNSFFAYDENTVRQVEHIKHAHLSLGSKLGITDPYALNEIEDSFIDAIWLLEDEVHDSYEYVYDQVVSIGEIASSKLVYHYFKNAGIDIGWSDVRDFLKTSEDYKNALINWEQTMIMANEILVAAFEEHDVIITQGFIGSTNENNTTTLGREGSDYTASVLAFCLDASSVHVWKDVEGIMTGDPKTYKDASLIKELSFDEAIEMCYFGAKVLHPKTIKPIQNKNIPLYVRPFENVENKGTYISANKDLIYPPIIIEERDLALVEIGVNDFSFVAEHHLSEIFSILADLKIKIYLMKNTAIKFIFSTRDEAVKLAKLKSLLDDKYFVTTTNALRLLTVRHGKMEKITELLGSSEVLFKEQFGDTIQVVARA